MKTKTIELYLLSELPTQEAKEKAYNSLKSSVVSPTYKELERTIKAFTGLFKVDILNCEVNTTKYSVKSYLTDYRLRGIKGAALYKHLQKNFSARLFSSRTYRTAYYKNGKLIFKERKSNISLERNPQLAGSSLDMSILSPIYAYLEHPDLELTYTSLITRCLHQVLEEASNRLFYFYTVRNFENLSKENHWYFYNNGKEATQQLNIG